MPAASSALVHLHEQSAQARVLAEGLQKRVELHPVHAGVALPVSAFEPFESAIRIAARGVHDGHLVRQLRSRFLGIAHST